MEGEQGTGTIHLAAFNYVQSPSVCGLFIVHGLVSERASERASSVISEVSKALKPILLITLKLGSHVTTRTSQQTCWLMIRASGFGAMQEQPIDKVHQVIRHN